MKHADFLKSVTCGFALALGLTVAPFAALAQDDEMSALFTVDPIFRDGLIAFRDLDGRGFSLRRNGNETLFRFEDQDEVWALESVPGPRGDEFLKNDIGRVFVRLTDLGGVILFDSEHPQGMPVDQVSEARPIGEPEYTPGLGDDLTAYLSLRLGKPVKIQIQSTDQAREAWLQDAARTAAEGLIRSRSEADELVEKVMIRIGRIPELELEESGLLTVYVNPEEGYEGRPSSDRIILFLKNGLTT